jgi:hypothetical protein
MGFMGFGRKGVGQGVFGRKGVDESLLRSGFFKGQERNGGNSAFERHFAQSQRLVINPGYPGSGCRPALEILSPEERGELLADLVDQPGLYSGYNRECSLKEAIAHNTLQAIWQTEIAVRAEHLGALLSLLTGDKNFRERSYYEKPISTLLQLIDSAIKQGAYLSSGDCEALAQMASDIRNARKSYRKADTKKMIARAERLEKLAGVKVSATEFLMQRCEGAENPWEIAPGERCNSQFWADLFAETASALEEIRAATKGSAKPVWMRDATFFAAAWPAVGKIEPRFKAWDGNGTPFSTISQHNGKRTGFADPDAYRALPTMIALAQPHSRYNWMSDQIPGLDILADLENPDWTALVEVMITQRRATKAAVAWQKEVLTLCKPLGMQLVEARLHDWLSLFHTPALNKAVFTDVCNGERFAAAIDCLEVAHPDWPIRHCNEIAVLGRAVAMKIASVDAKDICPAFHAQLIRLDDHVYKSTRITDGVLGLLKPSYKSEDGRSTYETLSSWMRLSVENEEFLRGAVWLVALMPDRALAIAALEKVAQTAATYMWTGDEGMRSKIIANAAIATLIAMGGNDIDLPVLRLSKVIDNCTINPPLFKYLNHEGEAGLAF